MARLVDYDAWENGYMPPSEHILIDALSYRGATVLFSASCAKRGFWLVTKGYRHGAEMRKLQRLVQAHMELLEVICVSDPEPQPELVAAMEAIYADDLPEGGEDGDPSAT